MRLVFGVLSLLVVLAIVGSLLKKQLQTVQGPVVSEAGAAAPDGTPVQQSRQLQRKVTEDVNRLMQQAPARIERGEQ
ncbi:MAG: hypothetical protein H0W40_04025 [Methylibium sp.]|uniref:hypothetical protein n=1 Tax=Methylibium sp. TaxID=2067992 RepID=UPI00183E06C3|nr:hypothetical protein [Methylibium sp.]MBA3596528.1 hypothetical protein [Methylibium sp.]